jgi:ribosomal protein S13
VLFNKKFGIPYNGKSPKIRKYERAAHSRRKRISIVQKFNDCQLLHKMRYIIERFYFFGKELQQKEVQQRLIERQKKTLHYMRKTIALPCNGQRTKTNARTAKRGRVFTEEAKSFLQLLSTHQRLGYVGYIKNLTVFREKIKKFRIMKDLMQQRRFKRKPKDISLEEHYDKVYERVISEKKRKKNKGTRPQNL